MKKRQTVYRLSRGWKLQFYEADMAGTFTWDLMYRRKVMASATDRIFASLTEAKKHFNVTRNAFWMFGMVNKRR